MTSRIHVAATIFLGLIAVAATPHEANRRAERVLFLLRYIGSDYGIAVQNGRVASEFEYREMLAFARDAKDGYHALGNAVPDVEERLARLEESIAARASWEEVTALTGSLVEDLGRELGIAATPGAAPDPAHGRAIYASDCAVCHGASGDGDGRAAAGMEPQPGSFRDRARMSLLSAAHVRGAIEFGVAGTAMPSFEGAYGSGDSWDLAAFVMSLAARGSPPEPEDPGLEVALRLESAFARVADEAFPAVVGVSIYRRATSAEPTGGWSGTVQDTPYPDFRRVRSRSGAFVTDDGYVLTCAHWLLDVERASDEVILDVETHDNVHARAWIVGLEPTVDLAVLKAETPIRVHPLPQAAQDAVRVGEWAIALGDPPGVERTFVVSTIAAIPRRDCYQESRTSTLLQSSARLGAESLGGPLVDIHGRMIGISVPGPGARTDVEPQDTLAYALPIGLVHTLFDALREKKSTHSPWLGIAVLNLTPDLRRAVPGLPLTGLYIDHVYDPSPASRAGIRVGDVLVSLGGQRLFAVPEFQKWLYLTGIGRSTALELVRDGETLKREVTIEERPAAVPPR